MTSLALTTTWDSAFSTKSIQDSAPTTTSPLGELSGGSWPVFLDVEAAISTSNSFLVLRRNLAFSGRRSLVDIAEDFTSSRKIKLFLRLFWAALLFHHRRPLSVTFRSRFVIVIPSFRFGKSNCQLQSSVFGRLMRAFVRNLFFPRFTFSF